MKKYLLIVAAVAMVFSFTSCKTDNTQFGGKYVGNYQFFKQNSSTVDSTRKGKTLPVLQLTENSVSVFDVIPLEKVSEGVFESSSEGGDLLTSILSLTGVNTAVGEQIKSVKLRADFTQSNHLTFTMSYNVEILNGLTGLEVRILQFDGDKQ